MVIQSEKEKFLMRTKVGTGDQAVRKCLQAALAHNPTYIGEVAPKRRRQFRDTFAAELAVQTNRYRNGVAEKDHLDIIEMIARKLSKMYGDILENRCLRIGTVQKALNLYLKFLWCLDADWPIPPHCPIDRRILQSAGIYGINWTELNSVSGYRVLISRLRESYVTADYSSLAEWELYTW